MKCLTCGYESPYVHCPCKWVDDYTKGTDYHYAILDDSPLGVEKTLKGIDARLIVMVGKSGVGKTWGAYGVAKFIHANNPHMSYRLVRGAPPKLPSLVAEWMEGTLTTPVLIYDELVDCDEALTIINHRLTKRLLTIVTANILPTEQRLLSRLNTCVGGEVKGEDWRKIRGRRETAIEIKRLAYNKCVEFDNFQKRHKTENAIKELHRLESINEPVPEEVLCRLTPGEHQAYSRRQIAKDRQARYGDPIGMVICDTVVFNNIQELIPRRV
jgi:hypothetical protein